MEVEKEKMRVDTETRALQGNNENFPINNAFSYYITFYVISKTFPHSSRVYYFDYFRSTPLSTWLPPPWGIEGK